MEIAEKTKERSTVILAVITLCIIGLTLIIFTRQTFLHQREAEEQHLFLTTRAVLLSVESSMRRLPLREGTSQLNPQTIDFFRALEQDGEVLFVGIVNEQDGKLLTSQAQARPELVLPPGVLHDMMRQGEWSGRLKIEGRNVYISGKRLKPLRGLHMSLRAELDPPGFLLVGVDMEELLSSYTNFRRNVLFQGLYILAAGLLTWGLGFSYLSRREQASKAVALESFQATLLDNLPDGLITLGEDGFVRSANPAALSILKQSPKEVLGRHLSQLPIELPACAPETVARPAGEWLSITHGQAHLEILALPLDNDRENSCLLIIRDRTQMRKLEKSLANAEKLAAVGALAAGVAHEVRNPLSSLRGFAQYFVKKLAGRNPEEEYAKTMVREADRLNRVISDLLFLGRPKAIAPKEIDLKSLVNEIHALLRFDLENKNVEISTRFGAPRVYADADALKQALLNLLLNSLDALDGKEARMDRHIQMPLLPGLSILKDAAGQPQRNGLSGAQTDTISTGHGGAQSRDKKPSPAAGSPLPALASTQLEQPVLPDPMPASPLRVLSGSSCGGVWIEVQDNGCGMTEEQKAQAFDAFFTAKEQGTGLGLALVQRTMLDHGGAALIASEPGRGCVVRLFFPNP